MATGFIFAVFLAPEKLRQESGNGFTLFLRKKQAKKGGFQFISVYIEMC